MELTNLPENSFLQGNKYRIIRFISSGGFGCTYLAEHTLLEQRVAIKEFFVKDFCNRDDLTSHITVGTKSKTELVEKLKKKFIGEARALSKMSHPGIVRVTDVFEENGTAYYVMDYVDGQSLSDIVKAEGHLTEPRAVRYILQACDALAYVHDKNRLHLDIKPGNIMVGKNGRVVLIDFGASKQYDEANGENTSTLMGKTPGYAPLEQMGNAVTMFAPASDIYALGATLYKLLTGTTPPESNLLADGEALPPLPNTVSAGVRNAVYAAMRSKRKERPQSIDEFRSILLNSDDQTVIDVEMDMERERKPEPKAERVPEPEPEPTPEPEPEPESKPKPKTSTSKRVLFWIGQIMIISMLVYSFSKHLPYYLYCLSEWSSEPTVEQVESVKVVTDKTLPDPYGGEYSYTGEVIDGIPNGKGKGKYSYGTYEGEYKNGQMDGEGTFKESGGAVFKGSFKEDLYVNGTLTTTNGDYFKGTMKDGAPSKGIWYDKKGRKLQTL
ncbi:MAG: protein kinase [Bacteroidaceae bacterium]|nr:protein kinase [Bacteroidaceae bacterium]